MASAETQGQPSLLVSPTGDFLNPILARSQREFTLLFLRHSIDGTPLPDQTLTEARLLGAHDFPALIDAKSAPLTVVPKDEEVEAFGTTSKEVNATSLVQPDAADMRQRRFARNFNKLETLEKLKEFSKALNALREIHESAVSMAMERTLDYAKTHDIEAFIEAQRGLECTIRGGLDHIDTYLKYHDVPPHEREKYLSELGESIVVTVIRNRLDCIENDAGKEAFFSCYQDCLHAYEEATKIALPTPTPEQKAWASKVKRESGDKLVRMQNGEDLGSRPIPNRVWRH